MLIFRGLNSTDKKPVALTIGNFDGVHLGHQALLKQLRMAAQLLGLPTAVLVFEPHPREFFTPQEAPARLTSMREKLEFFATLDVDRVYVCRFNSSFAQMSAVDFIRHRRRRPVAGFPGRQWPVAGRGRGRRRGTPGAPRSAQPGDGEPQRAREEHPR